MTEKMVNTCITQNGTLQLIITSRVPTMAPLTALLLPERASLLMLANGRSDYRQQ